MLGKTFTRDAVGGARGRGRRHRRAAHLARAQGGARRPGRSALARARPVRLPPGPRPPRRLRDALEAGATSPAPRRRRPPERGIRRRRGRGRRGDRVPLRRRPRGRPRRRGRSRDQGQGAGDARPRGRPRGVARRSGGGAAVLRAGGRADRRCRTEKAELLGRAGRDGRRGPATPTGRRRSSSGRSSSTRPRATRTWLRGSPASSDGSTPFTGHRDEAIERMERRSTSSPPTSRTRTSRSSRRRCDRRTGSAAIWSARPSAPRRRSTSPRPHAFPRRSSARCAPREPCSSSRGHLEEGDGAVPAGAARSRSSTTSRTTRAVGYFILSDQCFRRDQYTEALGYLDESLALSRKLGNRPIRVGASLAERTYPLFMLGRWDEALAAGEEFTEEQLFAGWVVLSLLQTGVVIHVERGELDEAHTLFSIVRAPRGVERSPGPGGLPRDHGRHCAARRDAWRRRSPTPRRRSRRAPPGAGLPDRQAGDRRGDRGRARPRRRGEGGRAARLGSRRSRSARARPTSTPRCGGSALASPATRPASTRRRSSSVRSGSPSGSRSRCSSSAELLAGDLQVRPSRCSPRRAGSSRSSEARPWAERAAAVVARLPQVPAA